MGRGGGGGSEVEIQNGKVRCDTISFETKMEYNGNTRVTKYEGTLSGSDLKLKSPGFIERPPNHGSDCKESDNLALQNC